MQFYNSLCCSDYNIIVLTETWLKDHIRSSELFPVQYNVYRKDRDFARGGGVLVAVSNSLYSKNLEVVSPLEEVDILIIMIKLNVTPFYIVALYISPSLSVEKYNVIFDCLDILLRDRENVICVGDFNVPSFHEYSVTGVGNRIAIQLDGFMNYHSLRQCNGILNANDRLLDLVLVTETVLCTIEKNMDPMVEEDAHHPALHCEMSLNDKTSVNFEVCQKWMYDFKRANLQNLYAAIANIGWDDCCDITDSDTVDDVCDRFYTKLYSVINEHVPRKKASKIKKYPVWFTTGIIRNIKRKEHYLKLCKRFRNRFYRDRVRMIRAVIKSDIRRSFRTFIDNTAGNIKQNPKRFWSFVNSRKGQSRIPGNLAYNNRILTKADDIVNAFALYFSSVYKDDDDDLVGGAAEAEEAIENIININTLSLDSVSEWDITASAKKIKGNFTCGPDAIPSFLVKDCVSCLMMPLKQIYNMILTKKLFPRVWKRSRITPIFKSGARDQIENYRPITLISGFAKLFEIILSRHIYRHISPFICSNQHGFVRGRSTVTNLCNFTQFTAEAMDERKQVDTIYFDFTKAFDRVPHVSMLRKLHCYGLHNNLVELLKSYLSHRELYVEHQGFESNIFVANSGVAQGSNIGPLLFILFVNDLCNVLTSESLLYADDLKIFRIVHNENDCLALQNDIDNLLAWCSRNGLSLNKSKCKVMSFSRKSDTIVYNYKINDFSVERCVIIKDLGVFFDCKLNFNEHILKLHADCCKLLGFVIRMCKEFDNIDTTALLYNALIRSKLDYCSIIWSPMYNKYTYLLELVQKRFLKYLYYIRYRRFPDFNVSYNYLLNEFNYISLANRRKLFALGYLFKLCHNMIDNPVFLSKLNFYIPRINSRNSITFINKRANTNHLLNSPLYNMCATYNSFNYALDIFLNDFMEFMRIAEECVF